MSWLEREMIVDSLEQMCDLMCGTCYKPRKKKKGDNEMYECFHCGARAVIWDNDFSFEDVGREGEGIVHMCHCTNCGAEIEYSISIEIEDEDDEQ